MVFNKKVNDKCGSLFVVATPIGNMEDITFRAVKILSLVDLIVAENVHLTSRLLFYYGIKTKLLQMHEHNENILTRKILKYLNSNMDVAMVSSAGTPLISDPGFRLLQEVIESSIKVVPIPGVSAVTASISVSGLPTDAFVFLGFIGRKKGKRLEKLEQVFFDKKTLIFYESPKRIILLLDEIIQVLGDRSVVLSREMTKIHEEFIRGTASSVLLQLKNRIRIKGECTLLVSGNINFDNDPLLESVICDNIEDSLHNSEYTTSILAKRISNKYGVSKSKIYNMILKVKDRLKD